MQKIISGFTHIHSPDVVTARHVTKEELKRYFEQLVHVDMNPTILKNCHILKAVKLFSEEFIGHSDEELNALGCLAHKLQLYWKKLKVNEDLAALSTVGTEEGNLLPLSLAPMSVAIPVSPLQLDDLDVPDIDLKKRSWKKLLRVLESKNVPRQTAKSVATHLERAQRKKDPSMGSNYHRLIANALKELQRADSSAVDKAIQRLV